MPLPLGQGSTAAGSSRAVPELQGASFPASLSDRGLCTDGARAAALVVTQLLAMAGAF